LLLGQAEVIEERPEVPHQPLAHGQQALWKVAMADAVLHRAILANPDASL